MVALLGALLVGCGGGDDPQVIASCEYAGPVDVSEVGEIKAIARMGDGWVVAGTRFNTMRVATVDANGIVGAPAAIGYLLEQPVTGATYRVGLRVEGSRWTAIFPDADSLIGYSVDTVTGQDSTYVYAPHFTNSEPIVVWYPTAYWFSAAPVDTNIGMQRIEIASGTEAITSHVWVSPVKTVDLTPGDSAAAPIVALDGVSERALTIDGVVSYGDDARTLVAAAPTGLAGIGPAVGTADGIAAAGLDEDGTPLLVRYFTDGTVDRRPAVGVPGPAVGFLAMPDEGAFGWLTADGTLTWIWANGKAAGPLADVEAAVVVSAPGADVVREGDEYAYAFTTGGSWYLARQACQPVSSKR